MAEYLGRGRRVGATSRIPVGEAPWGTKHELGDRGLAWSSSRAARVWRVWIFGIVARLGFGPIGFGLMGLGLIGLAGGCGGAQMRRIDMGGSKDAGPEAAEGGGTAIGQACATDNQCGSGFCVDGVCCTTACSTACETCAATGSVGTCIPADVGTDPRDDCPQTDPATCGTDGFCDGAGACEKYAGGVICQRPGCSVTTLTVAARCDGAGACSAIGTESCSPFTCNTTGQCKTTCVTDGDCDPPNACNNGSCGSKPIGASCSADADCNSGICAQGVCCATACVGNCKSCALPGSAGVCADVPSGQDPLGQCADSGAATCGTNGSCDGVGNCQKYASGTICGADTCSTGQEILAGRCDGAGVCVAGTVEACAPYVCGTAGDCLTKCATSADCAAGYQCSGTLCCSGSTCTGQALGTTCTAAAQCASGFCQQGVCCGSSCTGTCRSCALPGTAGACSSVPAGQDPLGSCSDLGASSCGTDGTCDGGGKCRLYGPTTICAAATCSGSTYTPARSCDGTGSCQTVTATLCTPYSCDATNNVCKTTCGANTDCAAPSICNTTTMSCGLLANGSTCTVGSACNSGFCQQGVCCATACAGNCSSCAIARSVGTCVVVPAGQDPLDQCADGGKAACGLDGSCDGSGNCQRYASGTQCAAASCSASTSQAAATCNGNGTCMTPATSRCTPYACGASACRTSCGANSDCASAAYVCTGGRCVLAANVTVKTHTLNAGNLQWIYFDIQVTNTGTAAIPLSQLTVSYWYTWEGSAGVTQTWACTYANSVAGGCGNVTGTFTAVTPVRTNADQTFQIGFTTAAGNLAAGATADLGPGFHKSDFSNFTQTNDYSYNTSTTFATTTKVTVYYRGGLLYGTEPM